MAEMVDFKARWSCFALLAIASSLHAQQLFTWRSVNIQGMGYVTGIVIHPKPPYDIYIRTDVGGAYRFDRGGGRWIPIERWGPGDAEAAGVESIAVDPADPNTVYAVVDRWKEYTATGGGYYDAKTYGEVMVSHSRGAFWTDTGLGKQKLYTGANDAARGTTGERLTVDPLKSSRLYYGSRQNGMWIKDTGAEWAQAGGGFPAAPGTTVDPAGFGVTFVVCDKSSGTAAHGATKRVYAGVYTSGLWMSDDGGVTWTNTKTDPNPVRAAVATDGTLWVTFGGDEGSNGTTGSPTSGSVKRYQGGKWSEMSPLNRLDCYSGIATDPQNAKIVLTAANSSFKVYRTTDAGASWRQAPFAGTTREPSYYPKPKPSNYNALAGAWGNAGLAIDPVNPNRAYQTNGYGVIQIDDVTSANPKWTWLMQNLEELVANGVKAPPVTAVPGTGEPGADLFSTVADMAGFRHASRDRIPNTTIADFPWVAQASSIAYCATKPEYMAFVGWDEPNWKTPYTGWSSDNGKTWKAFDSVAPGSGGKLAMSSADPARIVWAPAQGWDSGAPARAVQFTTDGGKTWTPAQTGGSTLTTPWQLTDPWWNGDVLAADPFDGLTFCLYNQGDVYKSTDGGANWTKTTIASDVPVGFTIKVNIVPNPAVRNEIWIALQHNNNQPKLFALYRSTDGAASFSAIPTVDGANFVAFGKGNTADKPFIYIHGRTGSATRDAIYKSEDGGQTWIRVSDPERREFGTIAALEADMRTKDLVYVATGGRGIFYGYGGIAQPSFPTNGVVDAAGFGHNGTVAPGEMLSIFGTSLGPADGVKVGVDEAGFISSAAGGTQVFFDGFPATMIYSRADQVSAVAPYWLDGRADTAVQVWNNGQLSPPQTLPVVSTAPGIFTLNYGSGAAVAFNAVTNALITASNPARPGDYVTIYIAGDGAMDPQPADGAPAAGVLSATRAAKGALVGGVPAAVDYSGGAPGFVAGLTQANIIIPDGTPVGDAISLVLSYGAIETQPNVTIPVGAKQ